MAQGQSTQDPMGPEFGFGSKHNIYLSSTWHTTKFILSPTGNKT
jgi:hypothetical protein